MPLKMYPEAKKHPLHAIKNIIAIAAGKGGVGKSSLTVNLALALKQIGYSVGIMDTDIYGPSIRKMLPEDLGPAQKGQIIIPAMCCGIKMISMAYFRKEQEASVVRAPIANGIISQFVNNVEWESLDYLLIDFPPGTGDIQLTLAQQANLTGAIMVTTPQEVAVMDVKKAMNLFDQVKIPIIGIVENMCYYANGKYGEKQYLFGKGGGERLARDSGMPFLGGIPIYPTISKCGDSGKSLFLEEDEESKQAATVFLQLAESVEEHLKTMSTESDHCLNHFELTWQEMETL